MRGYSTAVQKTRKSVVFVTLTLLLCIFASATRAQQQPAPRAPLTRDALVSMLRALTPERRDAGLSMLAAAIRDSGVDFEVTPAVEQELLSAGAPPELVAVARAKYRASAAASRPTGSPGPAA